ncbi:MAG TPA: acyl-CoA dehydrogenase family protein, partial [Candidatus Saccharimonadia bacterium]|nr:acyl-CoA dehydrogenase family protein [Candidatus Saccharimonadia bacterium]
MPRRVELYYPSKPSKVRQLFHNGYYDGRHVFVCLRQSPREKVTMAQPQEVIARASALQGLVRAEAPRTESQRTLTAPVVQALLDAELFYLMVPAALGGLEVDGRTYLEVVEAIAAADGSTGWCVMIGAEVNGMVGVNLPADVARRLLFQHGPICCAGSAIQEGPATIERTGDHYQVSGRWRFASGCHHSAYLFAFAPLYASGQP